MTIGTMPICVVCTRFRRDAAGPGLTCDAFPSGIPEEILDSTFDHRMAHHLDGGKHFQPIDDAAAAYAADLFSPAKSGR